MARAIDEITEFSGIGDFIDAPVKVYSSGMYVRLGFAIAVHLKPEILLVDEVLAVGDEAFQRKCFDHIYALRRRGTTIVLVSHDAGTMESLCDEVAWLDHGELQVGRRSLPNDRVLPRPGERAGEQTTRQGAEDEAELAERSKWTTPTVEDPVRFASRASTTWISMETPGRVRRAVIPWSSD